jgi:tryptophan-rich sensory protein
MSEPPPGRPRSRQWPGLAAWLLVTFAAAAVGSRFQPGTWYAALERPSFTPPGAVFGPVWTLLYLLMALAAWLVWRRGGFAGARLALSAYLLQLALNAAWSWLFFGEHRIGLALADIIVLWLAIAATAWLFHRHSRTAALLLLPYLAWVSFATALNFAFWRLN